MQTTFISTILWLWLILLIVATLYITQCWSKYEFIIFFWLTRSIVILTKNLGFRNYRTGKQHPWLNSNQEKINISFLLCIPLPQTMLSFVSILFLSHTHQHKRYLSFSNNKNSILSNRSTRVQESDSSDSATPGMDNTLNVIKNQSD